MKKLNEIMQELGFDKEGNQDVQKAFIKNLIKQAGHADKIKAIYPEQKANKKPQSNINKGVCSATYMSHFRKPEEKQLSFDLKNCGSIETTKKAKTQAG